MDQGTINWNPKEIDQTANIFEFKVIFADDHEVFLEQFSTLAGICVEVVYFSIQFFSVQR